MNKIWKFFSVFYWGMFLINLKITFSDNSRGEICKVVKKSTWYSVKTFDGEICILTDEFYLIFVFAFFIWVILILLFRCFKKTFRNKTKE